MLFLLSLFFSTTLYAFALTLCVYNPIYLYLFSFLLSFHYFLHSIRPIDQFLQQSPTFGYYLHIAIYGILFFITPITLLQYYQYFISSLANILHTALSLTFFSLTSTFSLYLSNTLANLSNTIESEPYTTRIKSTIICITVFFYSLTLRCIWLCGTAGDPSSLIQSIGLIVVLLPPLVLSIVIPQGIISDSAVVSYLITSCLARTIVDIGSIDRIWLNGMDGLMVITVLGWNLYQSASTTEKEKEEETNSSTKSSRSSIRGNSVSDDDTDSYLFELSPFIRMLVVLLLTSGIEVYVLPVLNGSSFVSGIQSELMRWFSFFAPLLNHIRTRSSDHSTSTSMWRQFDWNANPQNTASNSNNSSSSGIALDATLTTGNFWCFVESVVVYTIYMKQLWLDWRKLHAC